MLPRHVAEGPGEVANLVLVRVDRKATKTASSFDRYRMKLRLVAEDPGDVAVLIEVFGWFYIQLLCH